MPRVLWEQTPGLFTGTETFLVMTPMRSYQSGGLAKARSLFPKWRLTGYR